MKSILTQALPALLLLAAALAGTAFPDACVLDRQALSQGEVWRLWTGHLVHHTAAHFVFDVGVALVLVSLLRHRLGTLLVLPPLVGAGAMWLRPELATYAGLSGVLHGLTVLVCFGFLRDGRGLERWIGGFLLAGVLAKAVLEATLGTSVFTGGFDMGGVAVYEAHLLGALAGCVLALLRWRRAWRPMAAGLLWPVPVRMTVRTRR